MRRWPHISLLVAGLLSGLALPPVGQWWVLCFTLPVMLWRLEALDRSCWRQAWAAGLCFGFGYFVAALHWIGFAFLVDAKTYLWMMPFAVGGLAVFLALYWAGAAAVTVLLPRHLLPRYVSLPIFLSVSGWLRGHLLTGFPWAAPGLAADGMGGALQAASLVGMTGLTLFILLWAGLPWHLWQQRRSGIRPLMLPAVLLALLPLAFLWGEWRLASTPTVLRDDVAVRLVQPNIGQSDKWREDNSAAIFDQLITLSTTGAQSASHIIWPESSVPFLLDENGEALARIATMLAPGKTLLAGAIRRTGAGTTDEKYFTSILLIDAMGSVRDTYDKWRLVPGGEFLPFEPILSRLGFRKVASLPESFAPGAGPSSLAVPGAGPAGALICYEAIFPHALVEPTRPQWLVNVTNDGWFGRSVGPYQHLAQMRLRTVEQGLPAARAANTGISAIIDPLGRVLQQMRLGEAGAVDGKLPAGLSPTLYARLGDYVFLVLVVALAVLARILAILYG